MSLSTAYVVRTGYVYTDVSGAAPRPYTAGETLRLPVHVGDRAHQLERAAAPVPAPLESPAVRSPRGKRAAPGGDA